MADQFSTTAIQDVRKYKLVHDYDYQSQMLVRPDGSWVKHDDFLALCDKVERLVNALESGKSFAESWIEENGGIDGCDYQDRVSYENICAVLAACKA